MTATQAKKRVLILAGPNGAGKTTFAREFLPDEAQCPTFVNADLIAAGLSPFSPETAAMRAGRLMVQLTLFEAVYKPLVNAWALYDNSDSEPVLLDWGDKR
jgi:adenylate kinase family enzyme